MVLGDRSRVAPGLGGLPSTTGPYPAPGSANIWDTDLFQDSNTARRHSDRNLAGRPGPARVGEVQHLLHRGRGVSDRVSRRLEVRRRRLRRPRLGATGCGATPTSGGSTSRDSGTTSRVDASTLTGAAVNIAAGLDRRIAWCALEGQDAIEPDDLDGYTNRGDTGVTGGGWHLSRADCGRLRTVAGLRRARARPRRSFRRTILPTPPRTPPASTA